MSILGELAGGSSRHGAVNAIVNDQKEADQVQHGLPVNQPGYWRDQAAG